MAGENAAPTVREALTAAVEQHSSTPAESTQTSTPEPSAPAPSTPATPAPASALPPSGSGEKPYLAPQSQAPAAPATQAPAPKPGDSAPTPVGFKPPESWKQQIRDEHWKKLPVQVQAEVLRRERQVEATLRGAAEFRRTSEQLNGLVNNFRDVFQSENVPPLQTMANLLNISRTLKSAPPPQRAQMMAQVIQSYGVDLTLLDQALAFHVRNTQQGGQGGVNPNQMGAFQQMLDQRLAPITQAFAQQQQNAFLQQQQAQQVVMSEVETFAADPKNEYFDLLREEVADILEMGAKRGQKITLQEAYTRAMLANNDLAPLVSRQRVEEEAARLSAPAAQAARTAGLSVTGAPSGATPVASAPTTIRGSIEAAIDKLQGRA